MAWGCALCLVLAGGALLALLVQLLRWLRADGDLTLLWAEWRGKKPGKTARQRPSTAGRGPGVVVGAVWPGTGSGPSVRGKGMAACVGRRALPRDGAEVASARWNQPPAAAPGVCP